MLNHLQKRSVRSYVKRQSRITPAQKRALQSCLSSYGLCIEEGMLDFQKIFGRTRQVVLEIGFGMGSSLVEMAQSYPDIDFVGIEVHLPGVGSLLHMINACQISNVRVFHADAVDVLVQCVPDESLDKVQIFFPDPWPKSRHHKRRLIQSGFIQLLKQKIRPGGCLHVATDWEDYARQICAVIQGESLFSPISPQLLKDTFIVARPTTKFEEKGKQKNHAIFEFFYTRN